MGGVRACVVVLVCVCGCAVVDGIGSARRLCCVECACQCVFLYGSFPVPPPNRLAQGVCLLLRRKQRIHFETISNSKPLSNQSNNSSQSTDNMCSTTLCVCRHIRRKKKKPKKINTKLISSTPGP